MRTPKLQSKRAGPAPGTAVPLQPTSRARHGRQCERVEVGLHKAPRRNDLLPVIAVTRVPLDSLRPALRRVRRAEAAQITRIRASIRAFGICAPILVDPERRIVHGHQLWEAARQERLTEVPIIQIGHLSPEEIRLLSIALNRIGETGSWDEGTLRLEFRELVTLEEDLCATGFDVAEIDAILLDEESIDGPAGCDGLPFMPGDPVSRTGDLWRLGAHLLLQGDSRDPDCYTRLFEETARAALIITDVPDEARIASKVSASDDLSNASDGTNTNGCLTYHTAWFRSAASYLGEGGLILPFVDWLSFDVMITVGRSLGLTLPTLIVCLKSTTRQGSGQPPINAQALLANAILNVTRPGDIVLEPFADSGSTILAAEQTGRVCRAIATDGQGCDAAIRQWESMTGRSALHAGTGEIFTAIGSKRSEGRGI